MKVNEENVRKWVAALRSGEYVQKRGTLSGLVYDHPDAVTSSVMGYCCLGVACMLTPEKLLSHSHERKWLGIDGVMETKFVYMNDTLKMTFAEIADEVERLLLKPEVNNDEKETQP